MYKNLYEYIAKNMDGSSGRFAAAVTDMSEMEPDMLLLTVHQPERDGKAADFYLHVDGREEFSEALGITESSQRVSFGQALEAMKRGFGARLSQWKPDVVIHVQYPDEHSKMTEPYLYVESRFGRVPWKETMIELFAEDWVITK